MKPVSIRAELRKNDHTTVVNMPCNDFGIDIALSNLGETDITKTEQFCSHIGGEIRELAVLENRFIDVDELNFLAKYLDSFTENQVKQFQAAMTVTKPTEIKDMINLAFNLHNYSLITDFSDIAAVGRAHRLNVEIAIPAESDDSYDYTELGRNLVTFGDGTPTPYGVLYTNGLPMQELYDGQTFPQYFYEDCVFDITLGFEGKEEYLYKIITKSNFSATKHYLSLSANNTTNGTNVCWAPANGTNYQVWILETTKYMNVNANLHYVHITPSACNIRYINATKTSPTDSSYFNAGFFGKYNTAGTETLPVANLICEINTNNISSANLSYLNDWGCTISDNKLYKECNAGGQSFTDPSTFYIDSSNNAYIARKTNINTSWKCAVSGAPIMINGVRTTLDECVAQGWDRSWVYGTWRGCLAVATSSTVGASEFFHIAMKTTTANCTTGEAYDILNNLNLGIQNAIVLDGGGSFTFKYLGTTRATMSENRTINNIMYF